MNPARLIWVGMDMLAPEWMSSSGEHRPLIRCSPEPGAVVGPK